ncbi:MAG TPA: hypothetical protein VMG36_02870 [Thermoplasmata archaeon]|nr:hypothetical protein [Thermoplasmata archaeon]
MPAMPAPPSDTAPSSGPPESQRQARYNFLVGRLRGRQITMEEATELFGMMQGMLRTSESARLAALAQASGAPPPAAHPRPPPGPRAAAATGGDEMLLGGLLVMGAGAGLLAAMAKRIAEGPAPPIAKGRGTGGSSTR